MKLLDKIDYCLNENNNNGKIPTSLLNWVADYVEAMKDKDARLAREIKQNIKDESKMLGLNSKDVLNYFGDYDKNPDKVWKQVEKWRTKNQ